ncbi:energy transducer TonB [Sulfuricella sp.]|uniref:energy transducer TonB n=1 Tax=Sulfuricella sp. TaxID=2099377 RepID=UPI002C6E1DED|nr:energy transducer TonB [Sulfuricella sp.]HUX62586.1 energy transducer TonB [Sulfuricella sp.]
MHAIIWWGFTHFKNEIVLPKPLPVVQVALVTPPVPLEPRVTPPSPPKVERQQKPVVEKAIPTPKPVPVAQPVAEHALRQAPVEVARPSPPAPAQAQSAAEPAAEPPRYNADYLSNPPPAYPMAARRRGIEGTVLVRAEVAASGECLRVELKKTSGAGMLDHAALEAVRGWRFVPARRGSLAVVAWVEVPITFKLENN